MLRKTRTLPLAATLWTTLAGWASAQAAATQVTVDEGSSHSCAVDLAGIVYCWGDGGRGQLGDGLGSPSPSPVVVQGLSAVATVSAGGSHSCACERDGLVKCWGHGQHGQLGYGGLRDRLLPHPVPHLGACADVDAGGSHTCALERGGGVKCWGWGEFGQLGVPAPVDLRYPVAVPGVENATALSAGALHSCVVQDGAPLCWGFGRGGQLGHGAAEDSASPVQAAAGMPEVEHVACGYRHTCARAPDATVRCWGDGVESQHQEHTAVWEKIGRRVMLLGEAVRRSRWASPLGALW